MLLRKADFLPRHVQREVGHFAEIDQEIDGAGELDLVEDEFLELLEVGKGEFAEHGEFDKMGLMLGRDHDGSP